MSLIGAVTPESVTTGCFTYGGFIFGDVPQEGFTPIGVLHGVANHGNFTLGDVTLGDVTLGEVPL